MCFLRNRSFASKSSAQDALFRQQTFFSTLAHPTPGTLGSQCLGGGAPKLSASRHHFSFAAI
jgi:hypothetical protein